MYFIVLCFFFSFKRMTSVRLNLKEAFVLQDFGKAGWLAPKSCLLCAEGKLGLWPVACLPHQQVAFGSVHRATCT